MTDEIWVIKATYEKNADDGIEYFKDKEALAEAVLVAEDVGAHVQVYKCVPVDHRAFMMRAGIEITEQDK